MNRSVGEVMIVCFRRQAVHANKKTPPPEQQIVDAGVKEMQVSTSSCVRGHKETPPERKEVLCCGLLPRGEAKLALFSAVVSAVLAVDYVLLEDLFGEGGKKPSIFLKKNSCTQVYLKIQICVAICSSAAVAA